jgi:hypothetical protein
VRAHRPGNGTVSNLWVEIPQLSSNEEHFNQRHQCVVPSRNEEER